MNDHTLGNLQKFYSDFAFDAPFVLSHMISVEVRQLSKIFGRKKVWHNISFSHNEGVLGIAGPNGSGKSTLLKCLAGLLKPTTGEISWKNNQQELSTEELKYKMGFAAPYISLYHELSVPENLRFLSQLRKQPPKATYHDELLARVGLGKLDGQHYGTLSTGQQQRARLAAALFSDPDVLMLDEPGSNLDEGGRALVSDIIDRARDEHKLVILASNSETEIALCDRVVSVQE